jgi:signal transduction histidine kinase/Flp pilus assembly protein TadD
MTPIPFYPALYAKHSSQSISLLWFVNRHCVLIALMKKGLFTLLLFVCAIGIGAAQQADSLQQHIINASTRAFEMAFDDPDSARKIAESMLAKARTTGDELASANAQNSLGWSYFHLGEIDAAIEALRQSKDLFSRQQRPKEVIQVCINLSEVHMRKSGYQAALKHLLEADSVNATLGDPALQTDLYRQFAILYRELGSYDQATRYFQQAMDGFLAQGDYFRYVNTGISLSILHRKKGEWSASLDLLQKLDSVSAAYTLSAYQRAMVHENLGETWFGKGNAQNALTQFEAALRLFSDLKLGADMAYEAINVGKSHHAMGHWDEAERYLRQAYHLSDSLALTNYSFDAAMELAALFASKKDWEQAFSFSERARVLSDSLNLQEQMRFSKELAEKYENDKKEQEIALLTIQNELTDSRRKKALIGLYFFIAISVASLFIVWLMRSRIRLNKKLEHERKQNRIAGDIEDERVLNQFVVSLFGKNTTSEILRTLAYGCGSLLGLDNCGVYTVDLDGQALLLHSHASGEMQDSRALRLPLYEGAKGAVFASGKSILPEGGDVQNHSPKAGSGPLEMAVPVMVNGAVYAIVSAHCSGEPGFDERQLHLLERAAGVCAERISKLINEEKLREHIARDLHDDVGSTLTNIHILSKLAGNEADAHQRTYIEKIHVQSGDMMERMNDIVWAINPNNDSVQQTVLRMKEYAVELIESAGMECAFDVEDRADAVELEPEERKFIYLIFKESVHNAVKYSKASRISVFIAQSQNVFSFRLVDDGVGFDPATAKMGNGIRNMQARAKAIHATFDIASTEGGGTVVHLEKAAIRA